MREQAVLVYLFKMKIKNKKERRWVTSEIQWIWKVLFVLDPDIQTEM
jgi:hypothetical protein